MAGRSALVSPRRWQVTDRLVVSAEAVDAGLDEDETELGIFVLAVAFKVLANSDGLQKIAYQSLTFRRMPYDRGGEESGRSYLLDQHVEVLWNVWCEACMSLCQSRKTKAEAVL